MINEGLRHHDLKNMISPFFTVDQFQSKMGRDSDVCVFRFRSKEHEAAIDLMEFVEKGFMFVLDSDMSSGEEKDGYYSVFVEIERNAELPKNLSLLLDGIERLTAIDKWKFKWYKSVDSYEFDIETFSKVVPLSPEEYEDTIEDEIEISQENVENFFDESVFESIEVTGNKVVFKKFFSNPSEFKINFIGPYQEAVDMLPGPLQLDESSRSQVVFLNKFLGNYDINKIGGKFLVRNNDYAVILEKDRW